MTRSSDEILPVPAIGVGGIVFNEQGAVLLICRNKAPALGLWSVPGGKLEPGESLVAACQREIKEETNVDVIVQQIIAVVERRIENFHYIIIDFLAELDSGKSNSPNAQSDVSEARWIMLDELQDFQLVEGLEEIILQTYAKYTDGCTGGLIDIEGKQTDFIAAEFFC
jgi:8-oxo-dGTP diphosphatase